MPNMEIPQVYAALTADGGATGILTIADTTKIYPGALIYLNANTQATLTLQVLKILSGTTFQVRTAPDTSALTGTGKKYYRTVDCSAYTMLLSASITQNAQLCVVEANMGKKVYIP